MKKHISVELEANKEISILRAAVITACAFTSVEIKLMIPEIELSINMKDKLYKATGSWNFNN